MPPVFSLSFPLPAMRQTLNFADDPTAAGAPMKRILVVAYYFPPMGLSGVQRVLKFVKYLPEFGWLPTVLTVGPTGYYAQDASLLAEVEGLVAAGRLQVVRAGSLDPNRVFGRFRGAKSARAVEPEAGTAPDLVGLGPTVAMPKERTRRMMSYVSQLLFVPDNKIGWRRRAVEAASEVLNKTPHQAIFATAPPFTDFLIGSDLKDQFRLPLILDYRDAWLFNPLHTYPTPYHRGKNERLEREVIRHSDHILVVNRRIKEAMLLGYPDLLNHHDIHILSHGFDPADFDAPFDADAYPKPRDVFRLTHAGIFYERRTPGPFLRALRRALDEAPEMRGHVEAVFAGLKRDEDDRLVRDLGLTDAVRHLGYLDHDAVIPLLRASDLLWVTTGPGKDTGIFTPGKIYEYIGARKPILALVPDGAAAQIVREVGGTVVGPEDEAAIAAAMIDLFRRWQSGKLVGPSEAVVARYDRRRLTGELARMLELVVAHAEEV